MKCDRCGKETVVKDALGTTTNNYGISVTPDIELTAQVCYSCGHVELEVDPEEYLDHFVVKPCLQEQSWLVHDT